MRCVYLYPVFYMRSNQKLTNTAKVKSHGISVVFETITCMMLCLLYFVKQMNEKCDITFRAVRHDLVQYNLGNILWFPAIPRKGGGCYGALCGEELVSPSSHLHESPPRVVRKYFIVLEILRFCTTRDSCQSVSHSTNCLDREARLPLR